LQQQVLSILSELERIYYWLIIAYVLLSWLPNIRQSYVGELLGKLVEPYLSPFRKIIPPIGGVIDISPIVALFAFYYGVATGINVIVAYIFRFFG
jgi:YggT family protein